MPCSLLAKKLQHLTSNQQHYQPPCLHLLVRFKPFISIILAKATSYFIFFKKVKLYNSLITKPKTELLEQIISNHFCDYTIPEILQITLPARQSVSVDCGLFLQLHIPLTLQLVIIQLKLYMINVKWDILFYIVYGETRSDPFRDLIEEDVKNGLLILLIA